MVKCEVRRSGVELSVIVFVLMLLIVTVVSGLDIWDAFATGEASSDLEVNVDPWVSVTIPTNTVSLSFSPTTQADFDSEDLAVTVATNNETGYTLTMVPIDNITTDLTRRNGEELIPTLSPLDGGYTEQTFTTNKWGYKLATTNYLPFNTTNEIASNNEMTAGDVSTVTFASKIDSTVLSGIYELEIVFTAVGNAPIIETNDVTVSLDSHTESVTFSDGTNIQTATSSNPTVTLIENTNYTITAIFATGYELDAWSATAGTLGSTTANPTTYTTTSTSMLSVTSKQSQVGPVPPAVHTIADGGDMQEISSLADGGCPDTLTTGQAYTLTDSRDGESYKVARLADGNCWMLDNLALDLVAKKSTLTDANTNASTTTLNYLKNGGGSTSDQYATAAVSNWTSDYSYSAPLVNMASKDVVPTGAPTGGSGSNKVGGYYNFCAASAGSYCYGNGTSQGTSSGDAGEDICPAGWRMPTGGSSGKYQVLANAITGGTSSSLSGDDATNFKNALSTPLSGGFLVGSAYYQGSGGYFWSSTRYYDYDMYILHVGSSSVYPQYSGNRDYGYSVRCLLR